ncbi:hypothetical protein Tsubulata_021654 [Turnera subulata]|uniref:Uncharacterized protein n=1 Tax=Turnera subulata TaxID=218843 RepID=A0A9Q0JA28_9ROSI|nr:hypothetical protein Tsubulata_021654 [Turnera subulata]
MYDSLLVSLSAMCLFSDKSRSPRELISRTRHHWRLAMSLGYVIALLAAQTATKARNHQALYYAFAAATSALAVCAAKLFGNYEESVRVAKFVIAESILAAILAACILPWNSFIGVASRLLLCSIIPAVVALTVGKDDYLFIDLYQFIGLPGGMSFLFLFGRFAKTRNPFKSFANEKRDVVLQYKCINDDERR